MVCGIDEVGRGPLAGPVCAAAVILPEDFPRELLKDSKKLSAPARERAMAAIYAGARAWGVGWASAGEIDEINILNASLLAMKRAFEAMLRGFPAGGEAMPELTAVVDGRQVPGIPIPCRALVKADSLVPEVMAASILAKTARDRMMKRYSWLYPEYGYDRHKGYPTREHRETVIRLGPSPIQRRTFRVR
ncbi:MAG: ribonuclease HII [Spirochaetaceae bacterium]|jgi:ribonuclease HII|nr:ribonuclease HII [Spirochaetaceae bacterium]